MSDRQPAYRLEPPRGELRAVDLELARFLDAQLSVGSELLYRTACLLSWSYRQGDVCLELEEWAGRPLDPVREEGEEAAPDDFRFPPLEPWLETLRASPLTGGPGDYRPLVLDGGRLYLHRLHRQERSLARHIRERCRRAGDVDLELLREGLVRLFPPPAEEPDWQRVGAALGVLNRLTVISGGPGTGKTATVVRLMALLLEQAQARGEPVQIALAAPTGKAAARLKESVRASRGELDCSEEVRGRLPDDAATLHRLLGARMGGTRWIHGPENPLAADAVIVDEASMVDQALMNRLLEALAPRTRLILLGDKDQLASVEAGSVLGDICGSGPVSFTEEMAGRLGRCGLDLPGGRITGDERALDDHVVLLERNYRFGRESGIAALAACVNRGEGEGALELLASGRYGDLERTSYPDAGTYRDELERWTFAYLDRVGEGADPGEAFRAYRSRSLLTPHRGGPLGVEEINRTVERILSRRGRISRYSRWYTGKPVMITRNDRLLGLYNGDLGICLPGGEGEMRVWFEREEGWQSFAPARLSHWEAAWATTVHKSQGSEYERVVLMLPSPVSRVMSRELVYTAVTRARSAVILRGEGHVLKEAVSRTVERRSGLRDLLHSKRP
ncbi:MAG: exodeoxyribonuclease V subunit alpha [Balneolaceae bacterium]|nr:exodeoxyribonuclease V subunit alpha [Balneolaceae bacterium]